jgi:hypothetical protein
MSMIYKNGKFYKLVEVNPKTEKSVYSILKSILKKQNMSEKQKDFNASSLAPNDIEGDTIPILLYSSLSPEPFSAYGNIGHCIPDSFGPFKTSFFRIEHLKDRSFTCLSLLRPLNENGHLADSILDTYQFEKTDFTIKIETKIISIIQCASQKLIDRELLEIEQKF